MARYPRGHKPENSMLGGCVTCYEPVEWVSLPNRPASMPIGKVRALGYNRHTRRPKPTTDRDRRHCSSCGKQGEWYEFKPGGDGRCNECAP